MLSFYLFLILWCQRLILGFFFVFKRNRFRFIRIQNHWRWESCVGLDADRGTPHRSDRFRFPGAGGRGQDPLRETHQLENHEWLPEKHWPTPVRTSARTLRFGSVHKGQVLRRIREKSHSFVQPVDNWPVWKVCYRHWPYFCYFRVVDKENWHWCWE